MKLHVNQYLLFPTHGVYYYFVTVEVVKSAFPRSLEKARTTVRKSSDHGSKKLGPRFTTKGFPDSTADRSNPARRYFHYDDGPRVDRHSQFPRPKQHPSPPQLSTLHSIVSIS